MQSLELRQVLLLHRTSTGTSQAQSSRRISTTPMPLMAMDDADIVAKVHRNLITCEPGFSGAKVTAALQAYTLCLSFLPERA